MANLNGWPFFCSKITVFSSIKYDIIYVLKKSSDSQLIFKIGTNLAFSVVNYYLPSNDFH